MIKTTDNQLEQFIVVNEKDEILEFRSRFDCHHDSSLIHRAIQVAVFNSLGQIVLQKRSATKDLYPSFYALSATGHVSKGETYEDAAYRELNEEMGIKNINLTYVDKRLVTTETEREMMVLFKCVYNGPITFFKDEVAGIEWFSRHTIASAATRITPCSRISLEILKLI